MTGAYRKDLRIHTYAAHHFKEDDFEKKRTILTGFGSNFLIKDKQLVMQPYEWLIPIGEEYKQLEAAYLKLEPVSLRGGDRLTIVALLILSLILILILPPRTR